MTHCWYLKIPDYCGIVWGPRCELTCRVAPFRSRAGRSIAKTSSIWSTFATAGSCSSLILGSTSSTVAARRKTAVRRSGEVVIAQDSLGSACRHSHGTMSCIIESPCSRRGTSHIFPIYARYSHSIAHQHALLYLLEDASYGAQKLCLAASLLGPATSPCELGSLLFLSPAAAAMHAKIASRKFQDNMMWPTDIYILEAY